MRDDNIRGFPRRPSINDHSTKNLIIRHLLGYQPHGRYNLSSRNEHGHMLKMLMEEDKFVKTVAGVDEKYEVALFEYKNPTSGLKLTHRINRLDSCEDQDLLSWHTLFNETARVCKWSDEVKLDVLTQIVNINIQVQIGCRPTVDDLLTALLKLKYNPQSAYKYQNRLHTLRQEDFMTTRAYIKTIEITARKLGIALDWTEDMTKAKIQEVFFAGLNDLTRFEITRYSDKSYESVLNNLQSLDSLLIEKFRNSQDLESDVYYRNKDNTPYENSRKTRGRYKETGYKYNPDTKPKYCTLHKSHTHNNEECRARKKGENKSNSESKTFVIKETVARPKTIDIPIKIKNNNYRALIDTGSVENYLPSHIVSDLKLPANKKSTPNKVEIANGTIIEVTHDTICDFHLFEDHKITYTSKFNILTNDTGLPILGMQFLLENDSMINIGEGYIRIDNMEYEIDVKTSENEGDDFDTIVEKARVYQITNEEALKNMIKLAKRENKPLGEVPNFTHKIPLLAKFSSIPKEYPVPLNLKEKVEDHIKCLLSDGIIEEKFSECISPAFVILKKNGKVRLVVDYRYLNSITKKTHQFTPKVQEILANLKDSRVFSKIDLNQGYYQIKVDKEDEDKTGFRILNRTFIFKRMPFGLSNAPATFQFMINSILKSV
ncbi:Retrovirus-related Pol polyprotein from transposon 17.6 [Dictyocoela roeselum]|nr:Retrovirus-related Pol polyprotein from transposon 17.6 [Dictyocoela roeselum]